MWRKRKRSTLHITAGNEDWIPTEEELDYLIKQFQLNRSKNLMRRKMMSKKYTKDEYGMEIKGLTRIKFIRNMWRKHMHRWHNLQRWWSNGRRRNHWTNPIHWVMYDTGKGRKEPSIHSSRFWQCVMFWVPINNPACKGEC